MPPATRQIHLLGSSPYSTVSEALEAFTTSLPTTQLPRIPDGEPLERNAFVTFQSTVFPPFILSPRFFPVPSVPIPPNYTLQYTDLCPTGYATAALSSYTIFTRLRTAGKIPPSTRFQISLPTPINVITVWVRDEYMHSAEALYMRLILSELSIIQSHIPPSDLSIQWDIPQEIAHWENTYSPSRPGSSGPYFELMKPWYKDVREHILEELCMLADAVHTDAEVGFHLCYGDMGNRHWLEPADTGVMTQVINGIFAGTKRRVDFVHLPVPKERADEAYFEPLRGVDGRVGRSEGEGGCALFLGLVHPGDERGTRERIEVAEKVLGDRVFGIASECGLGRTPVEKLESVFGIMKACCGA